MSMQEINLYLPELRPKKLSFSANFGVGASAALLLVFIAIQITAHSSLKSLKANVQTIENQKVATSERVLKIKTASLSNNSAILDKRVAELRKQISDKQLVGKIIEWQNLGNEEGFASNLESLARHSNNTFSLEKIRISAGGKMLELSGKTRKAEEIPLYLQSLQAEKNLRHTRFGLLSMGGEGKLKKFSLGFDTVYEHAGDNK